MRSDPQALLRGLGKLVAVVLAAGLAGATIGIVLAKLSGSDDSATSLVTTTSARTSTGAGTTTAATQPPRTTTTGTRTIEPAVADYKPPRVKVLSARLDRPSPTTGRARVTIRVRVTNRSKRKPITVAAPTMQTGEDEVRLGTAATDEAGSLLETLKPGASATGVLRFSLTREATQRLAHRPIARLRIVKRRVALRLTTA